MSRRVPNEKLQSEGENPWMNHWQIFVACWVQLNSYLSCLAELMHGVRLKRLFLGKLLRLHSSHRTWLRTWFF
ncbi:unnamed protein product [Calypogeia fissa]